MKYIDNFQHPEAQNLIQTFENTVTNEAVLVFESLLRFTGKKIQINRTYKHKSCIQPVWWNAECQNSKSAKYEKLRELRKDHSERNKKDYKELCKARKEYYRKEQLNQIYN